MSNDKLNLYGVKPQKALAKALKAAAAGFQATGHEAPALSVNLIQIDGEWMAEASFTEDARMTVMGGHGNRQAAKVYGLVIAGKADDAASEAVDGYDKAWVVRERCDMAYPGH